MLLRFPLLLTLSATISYPSAMGSIIVGISVMHMPRYSNGYVNMTSNLAFLPVTLWQFKYCILWQWPWPWPWPWPWLWPWPWPWPWEAVDINSPLPWPWPWHETILGWLMCTRSQSRSQDIYFGNIMVIATVIVTKTTKLHRHSCHGHDRSFAWFDRIKHGPDRSTFVSVYILVDPKPPVITNVCWGLEIK